MTVEFWIGFIAALVVLGGIVYVLARTGRLPSVAPATGKDAAMARQTLEGKLRDLESTVRVLQQDHVRDVQRIGQLERELADAKERIQFLEGQQSQQPSAEPAPPAGPDFPLLAIFGPDQAITAADEAALNQSGIPFKCIYHATPELVAAELARRRRANELYPWLHIATHAGPEGLLLMGGEVVPREWWNKQLGGIEGVFLAGCTDVAIADWLIGVCKWVLSFTVDVDNELTRQFALVFWGALAEGKGPRAGYRAACRAVPALARVSDFRMKG
jgi:hypothetical protein